MGRWANTLQMGLDEDREISHQHMVKGNEAVEEIPLKFGLSFEFLNILRECSLPMR